MDCHVVRADRSDEHHRRPNLRGDRQGRKGAAGVGGSDTRPGISAGNSSGDEASCECRYGSHRRCSFNGSSAKGALASLGAVHVSDCQRRWSSNWREIEEAIVEPKVPTGCRPNRTPYACAPRYKKGEPRFWDSPFL